MKIFKLDIPIGKREIDAVETFEVRWESHSKTYYSVHSEQQAQFFTSKEEADAFKQALKDASKLLRDIGRGI